MIFPPQDLSLIMQLDNVSVTNLDSRTSLLPRQNNFPLVDLNIKHYTVKDTQVSNVSKDTTYIYIYI
jgi:hypothetical protein